MSTILKALRRLEEQKSASAQRPLRDEVVLVPPRVQRRNRIAIATAAAISFALVGAALVALFDRVPEPVPPREPAPVAAADVAAPPEPAAAPEPAPPETQAPAQVTVASPDANLRGIEVPPVVPIPPSEPDFQIARPEARPRPLIPAMKVDPGPAADPTAIPRPGTVRPSAVPKRVAEEAEEVEPAPVARADSAMHVERTQWHPNPERRVAWIEVAGATREVHEGDRVGTFVVESIEPAAVLFSTGSAQIRREVGR